MSIIRNVKTLFTNLVGPKAATASTPELLRKLDSARADLREAHEARQDAIYENADPWSGHADTTSFSQADFAFRAAKSAVSKLERELNRRGVDTTETPAAAAEDSYQPFGRPGPLPKEVRAGGPAPTYPGAAGSPRERLRGLVNEPNDARRAATLFKNLTASYLGGAQLHDDIRSVVRSRADFQQAARRLHPDKLLPKALLAREGDRATLHAKATSLWQAFVDIKQERGY